MPEVTLDWEAWDVVQDALQRRGLDVEYFEEDEGYLVAKFPDGRVVYISVVDDDELA